MPHVVKQEILDVLIERFEPERIIHFGSSVNETHYRDVDICLEKSNRAPGKDVGLNYNLRKQFQVRLDISFTDDFEKIKSDLKIKDDNYKVIYQKEVLEEIEEIDQDAE